MIHFIVYFSRYVKSIFVLYEVMSELYSVIMMAATAFISTCYLFTLFWVVDAHNIQIQEAFRGICIYLQKALLASTCLSVCLSICPLGSHRMDFSDIWYWRLLLKSLKKIHIWLNWTRILEVSALWNVYLNQNVEDRHFLSSVASSLPQHKFK